MAREYLKKATLTAQSGASDVHDLVQGILSDIETGGDAKAMEYAEANGINASVTEPHKRKANIRPGGYGENFATNRRSVWTH